MKTIFAAFLLLPVTTGLRSYACGSFRHNLYCEAGERIKIISGQYVFKYSSDSCNRDCKYQSLRCDCLRDFSPPVETHIKNRCNGKKTCNFRPPNPNYASCSMNTLDDRGKYYNNYAYSYIKYECLTVTTTLSARTTSTTRDQGTYGVTGQVYTDTSTRKSTNQDNSKPTSSTDKDISGTPEAVLNPTEINKPMAVNHNQDTADTAVIAGSVTGCIILVIAVIIVVVILKRKKSMCYKEDGTTNAVYETPTAFNPDVSPYTDLAMSHHSGDQPNYQNVSRFGQQGHGDVKHANK